jgi:hypothetical protein
MGTRPLPLLLRTVIHHREPVISAPGFCYLVQDLPYRLAVIMDCVMKNVKQHRDPDTIADGKAVRGRIETVIIFNDKVTPDPFIKTRIRPDKAFNTCRFIPVHSPDMDLDPGSPVKPHQFKELCMIGQFIDTAAKYIRVRCVDEHKLIRM